MVAATLTATFVAMLIGTMFDHLICQPRSPSAAEPKSPLCVIVLHIRGVICSTQAGDRSAGADRCGWYGKRAFFDATVSQPANMCSGTPGTSTVTR